MRKKGRERQGTSGKESVRTGKTERGGREKIWQDEKANGDSQLLHNSLSQGFQASGADGRNCWLWVDFKRQTQLDPSLRTPILCTEGLGLCGRRRECRNDSGDIPSPLTTNELLMRLSLCPQCSAEGRLLCSPKPAPRAKGKGKPAHRTLYHCYPCTHPPILWLPCPAQFPAFGQPQVRAGRSCGHCPAGARH